MTHETACGKLCIPLSTEQDAVDPMRLAFNHESRSRRDTLLDYRTRAILRCIEHKVSFATEWNTTHAFARLYVYVACPCCKGKCNAGGGGGNGTIQSVEYCCNNCKLTIVLTLPATQGISVRFPEEPLPAA